METERKSRYELFLEQDARTAQPTKPCTKCGQIKAISEYYKDKSKAIGVKSACKECWSHPPKYKSNEDKFWKRYHAVAVMIGDCMMWVTFPNFKTPTLRWGGKTTTVKRVVYVLAIGDLSESEVVISTCGNPWCVRQGHMEKATAEVAEMRRRNKLSDLLIGCGILHTLTVDNVREIRQLRNVEGWRVIDIADKYGCTRQTIGNVLHHRTWAHVQ